MLTVIIASYQYGHLAAHCIESLLSQTKQPDRILFVDDGVGDCTHLPDIYPEIEYVLREENLGTVDNFQDMLMRVKTEYTMFIGADNWFRSDAVEKLLEQDADIVTYEIMVTGEFKMNHPDANRPNAMNNGDVWWHRGGHHETRPSDRTFPLLQKTQRELHQLSLRNLLRIDVLNDFAINKIVGIGAR